MSETTVYLYEENAEAFYRETHVMAPGKDVSAAMGGYDADELRHKLWRVWLKKREAETRIREQAARIRQLEAQQATGEPVAWDDLRKDLMDVYMGHPPNAPRHKVDEYIEVFKRYAHPRPRVGVTEADAKLLRSVCEYVSEERLVLLYESGFLRDMSLEGEFRASVAGLPDRVLALVDEAAAAEQPGSFAPAPGVVETGFFAVADRNDVPVRNGFGTDERYAARIAEKMSGSHPECAPWRVMRVCLKPLANGGGEVGP